jgi:hypothetical protein
MSTYILAVFLLLLGVTHLISTEIPRWVVGLAAILAGLALLVEHSGWMPKKQ